MVKKETNEFVWVNQQSGKGEFTKDSWRKGQNLEKGHWGLPFLDNAPQTGPEL